MNQKNDDRIMALKTQIAQKRDELKGKNKKFVPVTNCLLELDGVKYNLHLHSTPMLMMRLYALKRAATELFIKYPEIPFMDVQISGYKIDEWLDDIKANLDIQAYKMEKQKLDSLEKELTKLLSDDKQTELQIDELEKMLCNM